MSTLHIVLLIVFIFVCFLLISAVLLQTGKGGGMAGLGGGGSDTAFGAHTANVLQKFTGWFVLVFFVLVVSLSHTLKDEPEATSVIDTFKAPTSNQAVPQPAPQQAAPAQTPAPSPTPATPTPSNPAPKAEIPALPTTTPEPSQAPAAPTTVPTPAPENPTPKAP